MTKSGISSMTKCKLSKPAVLVALACLTLPASHFAAAQTAAEPWKNIAVPPLHDFKPVQPKRINLANGLVIFLQEDHELPFIDGTVLIRGGSRDEPGAKVGLVSLYGEAWRTSGTAPPPPATSSTGSLASKAASIETGNGVALHLRSSGPA